MNFQRIQKLAQQKEYTRMPIKVGQQLEIHEQMGDGDNSRIWKFKGLVIALHKPNHHDGTFTVIGETSGVKIQKTYPLSFPKFAKIILLDEFKTRKSKIYYIKEKVGKDARMKSIIGKDARGSTIEKIAC
ncbi:MAG TPA: 50S ribosomal protein L19 [Candidatus Absconditabacterales bacterium]|nr:50S ribosomal protein L19 [Candidatus Absconditabacterales bacterium]HNG97492.1 50S ribosomal protein L19 [Candidatus Absconditabacterales bacterium]